MSCLDLRRTHKTLKSQSVVLRADEGKDEITVSELIVLEIFWMRQFLRNFFNANGKPWLLKVR